MKNLSDAAPPVHPEGSNGATPRPLNSLKTPREAFAGLLARGFWPVPIYPRGHVLKGRGGKPAEGKEPIGAAWGADRWTAGRAAETFKAFPGAGVGVCLGPGRGPGGEWVIDAEGDGPEAEASRLVLFGGETVPTVGWGSTRGGHQLFTGDPERLKAIAALLKPFEVKGGTSPGVFHVPQLPGLELRIGGFKRDGAVKQLQSVVPPTVGTDGRPRRWTGAETVAPLPDSFYAALEAIAAPAAPETAAAPESPPRPAADAVAPRRNGAAGNPADAYLRKALANEAARVTGLAPGERRDGYRDKAFALAGWLHYHERFGVGYSEAELAATLKGAHAVGVGPGDPVVEVTVDEAIAAGKAQPRPLPPDAHRAAEGHPGRNGTAAPGPAAEPAEPPADDDLDALEIIDGHPEIAPQAFHGIAGEVVRMIDPHTEGDRVGVLVQILVGFANLVGRGPYVDVSATRHFLNLFCVLVGGTSSGRKGTSWDAARWVLAGVDPAWAGERIQSGLVSGEGLIHHVRDEERGVKEADGVKAETVIDPRVTDKRLLIVETELSRALKAMNKDGNTLSDVVRQAWDSGTLRTLGKHKPGKANGAYISIIGHSTPRGSRLGTEKIVR